jgi:phosphoribosylanthranilate isomerase
MGDHVRVKICGITSVADASRVVELGAESVGLNFHPSSPRVIDTATAGRIVRCLPPFVEAVGVFVEVPVARVIERIEPLGRIRTIQMHGKLGEPPDCFPYSFIPAFSVRSEEDLERIRAYVQSAREQERLPAAVLVDGHAPGLHGGTGRTAPWDLLAGFDPGVPLILAGGLTPENVAEAVRRVRPYAVDVASGVESAPGKKDMEKVKQFIAEARR